MAKRHDDFDDLGPEESEDFWSEAPMIYSTNPNPPEQFRLPRLVWTGARGEQRYWEIGYSDGELLIRHGKVGGKAQEETIQVVPMSNRTQLEQGFQEASQRHKRHRQAHGMTEQAITLPKHLQNPKPMLAPSDFEPRKFPSWPVMVSVKLDGWRMLARDRDGRIVKTSRSLTPYQHFENLDPEIRVLLSYLPPDSILDGELYNPAINVQIQRSICQSGLRSKQPPTNQTDLFYWLFDVIVPADLEFQERYQMLLDAYAEANQVYQFQYIVVLKNFEANNAEEVIEYRDAFRDVGYEGAMARNPKGKYKPGGRDYKIMQKVKFFPDTEATIIEVLGEESKGRERGAALFLVQLDNGVQFMVRPCGSLAQRRKWLLEARANPALFIGKLAKIQYSELSNEGVPQQPIMLEFRDPADLS